MFKFLIVFVILCCKHANCQIVVTNQVPYVQIQTGTVNGTQSTTVSGLTNYYAFRGMRYAEPPTRFQVPVPAAAWNGVADGTNEGSQCIQTDTSNGNITVGSEDCLFINVYVPQGASNMAVMAYIHGGAFMWGNSSYFSFGPDYLLDNNVIYVSFNYRLGILGWLSTGDAASSGNYGLHDQILALNWIQNNIASFGGNPDQVTIFGESAGSVSVGYILQIPQAAGTFINAILQSGSPLCNWGKTEIASTYATSTGIAMGFVTTNSTQLVQDFRTANITQLQFTSFTVGMGIFVSNALMGLPWGPVQENASNPNTLFTGSSYNMMQSGQFADVNILLGFTSNEAAYLERLPNLIIQALRGYLANYDANPQYLPPYDLTSNYTKRVAAGIAIKQYFFANSLFNSIALADIPTTLNFIDVDQFVKPILQTAIFYNNYVNTYLYQFAYAGNLSGITNRLYLGPGHSEDLYYIFRSYSIATSQDILIRNAMCTWWTNFAKYSNPTPADQSLLPWPLVGVTSGSVSYMNINNTISVQQNPFNAGWQFYVGPGGIYPTYGDNSYSTF